MFSIMMTMAIIGQRYTIQATPRASDRTSRYTIVASPRKAPKAAGGQPQVTNQRMQYEPVPAFTYTYPLRTVYDTRAQGVWFGDFRSRSSCVDNGACGASYP